MCNVRRSDKEGEGSNNHHQLQEGHRGLDGRGVQEVLLHEVPENSNELSKFSLFDEREPSARYAGMGNITAQLELKKSLECKSFDWFINNVAYDMLEKVHKLY